MKTLATLFLMFVLFANRSLAHSDHALGEGALHNIYHVLFTVVVIGIIVSILKWVKPGLFKRKK